MVSFGSKPDVTAARPTSLVERLDKKFYPENKTSNWDDLLFRQLVLENIDDEITLLDVGAGVGRVKELNFRDYAKKIIGVDLDERIESNSGLDEFYICGGENLPDVLKDIDVALSVNVLEHLENPEQVFREIQRTLKPGGKFFFKTPNTGHYIALISRLTPLKFHKYYNRLRGRAMDDTFSTYYRANSLRQIRALAAKSGFDLGEVRRVEGRPEYLRINPVFYLFGIAYERLVNFSEVFSPFRAVLLGVLVKKK